MNTPATTTARWFDPAVAVPATLTYMGEFRRVIGVVEGEVREVIYGRKANTDGWFVKCCKGWEPTAVTAWAYMPPRPDGGV